MKKVVYGISRYSKNGLTKTTGVGYITDTDLVIACLSKKGTPYIRVFEDCLKDCHELTNKNGEYQGSCYEIREIEYETDSGSKDTKTVELEYNIWYKIAD